MDIKRQKSNITQLFPKPIDHSSKPLNPDWLDDPSLTPEDSQLINEVLAGTNKISHDLNKLNLQLQRLLSIMKRQLCLNDEKRKQR